jgi:hypothetical protein
MDYKILAPVFATFLQLIVKFFVGRKVDTSNWLELLIELPMTLIFLSTSLSLVFMFQQDDKERHVLVLFLVSLFLAFGVVYVWRRCKTFIDATMTKRVKAYLGLLLLLNYSVSAFCLYSAFGTIDRVSKINTTVQTDKNLNQKK